MITSKNLKFYSELYDKICSRGKEIAKHLDFIYRGYSVQTEVCNNVVYINVMDRDYDFSDGIRMTYEEFSSENYLEIAEQILLEIKEKEKIQKEKYKEEQRKLKEEADRKEYERLKKIFENN